MENKATWTTQDGRTIEIAWMASAHLVATLNMLMRNNRLMRSTLKMAPHTVRALYAEVQRRGLDHIVPHIALYDQFGVCKLRETPTQLCMLRAMLDTDQVGEKTLAEFQNDPQRVVEFFTSNAAIYGRLMAKFVEYRLAR